MDEGKQKRVGKLNFVYRTDSRISLLCMQTSDEFNVFCGIQLVISRMDSEEENPSIWTLDLLCQKWQLRNKDIGMIINLSDHSKYYSDLEYGIILIVTT